MEIYCDESRQDLLYNKKSITDTNRYIFIGGVMINSNDKGIIEKKINNLKKKYNLSVSYEVKWSKVTKRLLKLYMEIIDVYISFNIEFRCICIDSSKVNLHKYHEDNPELGFYKFYYQLLNNWILKENEYYIYTDKIYDDFEELQKLKECLNNSHHFKCVKDITEIDSEKNVLLQLEDILMGIVAYKVNLGNRGISKVKLKLVSYFEEKLGREILPTFKSSKKFNLFKIRI